MRKPIIAGNWKMNKTTAEAVSLVQALVHEVEDNERTSIVVCPPFTALKSISTIIEYDKPNFALGAQNIHWEDSGAFTGEVSPLMLKELGVTYAIIGHSERRQIFSETSEMAGKRLRAALAHGITPILCVGESLEQKEAGETTSFIREQIFSAFDGVGTDEISSVVVAYEPIWAIGTGKSAFPEDANDVIRHIRALIGSKFTPDFAKEVRILYGGSVNAENIDDYMAEPDIDGALVGGAALDAKSFARIANFRA